MKYRLKHHYPINNRISYLYHINIDNQPGTKYWFTELDKKEPLLTNKKELLQMIIDNYDISLNKDQFTIEEVENEN